MITFLELVHQLPEEAAKRIQSSREKKNTHKLTCKLHVLVYPFLFVCALARTSFVKEEFMSNKVSACKRPFFLGLQVEFVKSKLELTL